MRISKAYCEQAREVFNIYEAKRFYFSQSIDASGDRPKLSFLCSDENCRAMHPPVKVTGVNYHISADEEDAFKSPHYRENQKHSPLCEWVKDEEDIQAVRNAVDRGDIDENELPNRFKRVSNGKEHDLIDQFWLEDIPPTKAPTEEVPPTLEVGGLSSRQGKRRSGTGERKRRVQIAPTVSHALHELVTCFRELDVEERKSTPLTIGHRGKRRTYYEFFHPINHLNWNGLENVIFHGGAKVKRYGLPEFPKGYSISFFDSIKIKPEVTDGESQREESKKIEFYLKIEQLKKVPYWAQYVEYLNQAADGDGYYIQCFLFLPNEPRFNYSDEHKWKVDIVIPSMSHLDLMAKMNSSSQGGR
jgi:hypothetical protein